MSDPYLYIGHDKLDDLAKVITYNTPLFHGLLQKEVDSNAMLNTIKMRMILQLANLQDPYLHYWRVPLWQYTLEDGKVVGGEKTITDYRLLVQRAGEGRDIIMRWVSNEHPALVLMPGILKLPEGNELECWPSNVLYLDQDELVYKARPK